MLSPKGWSSENLNQRTSGKSSEPERRCLFASGCLPPARPLWAQGTGCQTAERQEQETPRREGVLSPSPAFRLPCEGSPQTLLCCLCMGGEGLLLYLDPILSCEVILLAS